MTRLVPIPDLTRLHYKEPPPVGAHVWFLDGWDHIREGIVSRIEGRLIFINGNDEDPLYNRYCVTRLPEEIYKSHLDCLREQIHLEQVRHNQKMNALLADVKDSEYIPPEQGINLFVPDEEVGCTTDGRP